MRKALLNAFKIQYLTFVVRQIHKSSNKLVNKINSDLAVPSTRTRYIQNINVTAPIGPFLFFACFVHDALRRDRATCTLLPPRGTKWN